MPETILYSINPDRNTPWNTLPDLPINSHLYRIPEILEQLVKSRSALARLQGRSIAIPNQGLLINTISLQEAKASSAVENIFTTDDELYRAFSEKDIEEPEGAPKEILRYREALWSGHEYLKNKEGFDINYFVKIFQEIKQSSEGIRSPLSQVVIRQGGTGPNAGKTIYTPPRGQNILEAKMENLISFINDDTRFDIDPLIKMAIAHYQFEIIHPFRDGNGRTGRVFNIHYLTKKELLDLPILFLSKYIIDHKEEYYTGLSGVSQKGDWGNWILYILKAVEYTSNITYYKINDLLDAQEIILKAIISDTDIRRPEQLVQAIFTQPFTKVQHLTSSGLYAEKTARNYLNKLTELQILEKRTISGHHYYLNSELYRILSN